MDYQKRDYCIIWRSIFHLSIIPLLLVDIYSGFLQQVISPLTPKDCEYHQNCLNF
ncbi:hypothetical protein C7212DRAFT_333538 [Tuber magnatum]|uniref:Uncharacterized protein n=1 Tax=Tuber magnatum TaxID=42249 RepID=A0A317SHU4_9PEZI|nr:hypothetical protein C7212DRAFT_333538 [Tuber magnatum]